MKKFLVLSICAAFGFGAFAQEAVVKDAEKAMKGKKPYKEVVKIMTPAFSDPVTSQQAQTYFIVGKAGFNEFDDMLTKKQFNQMPEGGDIVMAEALVGGYENFMKALPLDSLPDAKGKVKPKYSKDIINVIAGHYPDFGDAGVNLYNNQEYDKAYTAWDVFVNLPQNPNFAKVTLAQFPDTLLGQMAFYQGLAAYQANRGDDALNAFIRSKELNYGGQQTYDQIIAVATELDNKPVVLKYAKEANALYGSTTPNYIGILINDRIEAKDYTGAINMIDEAIAANPGVAQYYIIKGIIYEQEESTAPKAREQYAKALEVEPANADAMYQNGRMLFNDAMIIYNNAPSDDAGYTKVFHEQLKPAMLKAIDMLENACNYKDGYTDALKLLEQAYYMLNDEKNYQYTLDRLAQ